MSKSLDLPTPWLGLSRQPPARNTEPDNSLQLTLEPPSTDRAAEIEEQCKSFHAAHPEVWSEFERVANTLIDRGHDHYSADGVMHIVRFNTPAGVAGADGQGEPFKINNNFVSLYARRFARLHPESREFFQQRRRTSQGQPRRAAQ